LYTARMNDEIAATKAAKPGKEWQKTSYANLIRYVPSGIYYARLRVKGKLIRKSLKTDLISVGKLRLADFEKQERQRAESADSVSSGKMTVNDAIELHRRRVAGDVSLKPRTREYHDQRIAALLKSWSGLDKKEIRSLTKTDCLNWSAKLGGKMSATAFNHTIGILRVLLEIGIEMGARYDNPARFIKRASERPKTLTLPEPEQFLWKRQFEVVALLLRTSAPTREFFVTPNFTHHHRWAPPSKLPNEHWSKPGTCQSRISVPRLNGSGDSSTRTRSRKPFNLLKWVAARATSS